MITTAALAGFVLLAYAYSREPVAGWDTDVAIWVAANLPTWLEWVARPFSWLGGWVGVPAVTTISAILLIRRRAWLDVAFLLTAVIGSQLVVAVLKHWFDRSRPDLGPVVPPPSSASFPSGHATSGAACLGAVAVLLTERLPSPRDRALVWALTVVLGLGVGLSRIALGVHYVSDVLAGWCLGLAWLAGCLLARDALRRA